MLTASGMRQHYLLGAYVRDQYINKTHLLSPSYNANEFYVQSTQVPRTIQSAEAQVLGIYPLGTTKKLEPKQVKKAVPNIKIDDLEKIQKELGLDAVIDGFQPIPVHNYNIDSEDDVLGYANCPLLVKDYETRLMNDTFWKEFDEYYGPRIYQKLAETFDFPVEQMKFMVAYMLADVLF